MVTYDQLGPKVHLRFDYNEYYVVHDIGPGEGRFVSHASVFEASETDPLEVAAEDYADIGHAALYCAYLHHSEGRDISFDYRGTEIELSDRLRHKSLPLPFMSPEEIDSRFDTIQLEATLTHAEKAEIVLTALTAVMAHKLKQRVEIEEEADW